MRILHIIDSLSMGGAENLLIGLAGEQVSRGHDVTVAPLVWDGQTSVGEKMEERGVLVKPFKSKGSVYNPLFIIRICRVIRKYDIVHVHLFPALYWAGFAKLISFCKVPLIYTEHSTKNKRRANKLLHAVDRYVYKNAYKKIIACSDIALDTYCEAYPSVKHVCTIKNGIDVQMYVNAEPYTKLELLGTEDCFIVTMVARFMSMKRQDTVVEALAKLSNNIHVVFVGGTENDEGLIRIRRIAESLNVSERVHFLYSRKDVPRILKTSDVVIMASDYEGLSLSSIEGMAAGKPFIATNVNGLKEVVGGAGILFENKDSDTLAQIINNLANDKEYYHSIAKRCSMRAMSYDVKGMVDSYMNVYKEVTNINI